MCGSMVDIQSAMAEIKRGKKRKKKKQHNNIMSASATLGGHKKLLSLTNSVRAQKSQTENSKNHLGLNPYDICTGALT